MFIVVGVKTCESALTAKIIELEITFAFDKKEKKKKKEEEDMTWKNSNKLLAYLVINFKCGSDRICVFVVFVFIDIFVLKSSCSLLVLHALVFEA